MSSENRRAGFEDFVRKKIAEWDGKQKTARVINEGELFVELGPLMAATVARFLLEEWAEETQNGEVQQ